MKDNTGHPAMTQDALAPLFAPLTLLHGIGPTVAGLLKRAIGGERLIDLLFHLPEGYLDRRARPTLKQALQGVRPWAKPGQVATLAIEVVRHEPPANPRQPYRVVVTDGTGFAELVFFHFTRAELMAPGAKLLVSGKLERVGGQESPCRTRTTWCRPRSRSASPTSIRRGG